MNVGILHSCQKIKDIHEMLDTKVAIITRRVPVMSQFCQLFRADYEVAFRNINTNRIITGIP